MLDGLKSKRLVSTPTTICIQINNESPKYQKFCSSPDIFESVDAWTHEFTELSLWYLIKEYSGWSNKKMKEGTLAYKSTPFLPEKQLIPHIITSLHTKSIVIELGFFFLIDSDDYYELLSSFNHLSALNLTQYFIIDLD